MGEYLKQICDMLDTYTGRDKVIRTLCYTTKLVSASYADKDADFAKKFAIFSTKMSQTRATLRLFDDLPMIQYTMDYGFGEKEPDKLMAAIGTITNVIDHLYYPVDKICWLMEYKIINVKNPALWDNINSVLWVASIYLNLMKTIRSVLLMAGHHKNMNKLERESTHNLKLMLAKQQMEKISVFRLTLDFIHATSTLPSGWLWGGKFSTKTIGVIGTVSSFIGLYQYFAKKKLSKQGSQ